MVPTPPADSSAEPATPKAIAARWALVTARDIMRSDVITVPYSTPLSDVERVMSDHRISGVPVTDEGGHIVGIVSLRDLIDTYAEDPDTRPRRGAGFYSLSSEEMLDEDFESFDIPAEAEETAEDIMTSQVYSVQVAAGLKDIAGMMVKHRIHRVLVEEAGHHVGLISTMEVLAALSA